MVGVTKYLSDQMTEYTVPYISPPPSQVNLATSQEEGRG